MKTLSLTTALILSTALAPHASAGNPVSVLTQGPTGKSYLQVDGKPFMALAVQLRLDRWHDPKNAGYELPIENAKPLFTQAASLGFNTVLVPLRWRDYEAAWNSNLATCARPTGFTSTCYDPSTLQFALTEARANNLKVMLLWYGSNVDGTGKNLPQYVYDDPTTYTRRIIQDGGVEPNTYPQSFIPLSFTVSQGTNATLAREKAALADAMAWLAANDGVNGTGSHTVIAVQIDNEFNIGTYDYPKFPDGGGDDKPPGGPDMSYDETTKAAYQSWLQQIGAACGFSETCLASRQQFAQEELAKYMNELAGVVKTASVPLVTFVNVNGMFESYANGNGALNLERALEKNAIKGCTGEDCVGSPNACWKGSCNIDVLGYDPYQRDLKWINTWQRDITAPKLRFVVENSPYASLAHLQGTIDAECADGGTHVRQVGIQDGDFANQAAELPRLLVNALAADAIGYDTYEFFDETDCSGLRARNDGGYSPAYPIATFSAPVLSALQSIAPALATKKTGVDAFYFGKYQYPGGLTDSQFISGYAVTMSANDSAGTEAFNREMATVMTDATHFYFTSLGGSVHVRIDGLSCPLGTLDLGTFDSSGGWTPSGAKLNCGNGTAGADFDLQQGQTAALTSSAAFPFGTYKVATNLSVDPMILLDAPIISGKPSATSTSGFSMVSASNHLHLFFVDAAQHLRELYWSEAETGRLLYDFSNDPGVRAVNGGQDAVLPAGASPNAVMNGSAMHVFARSPAGALWEFYYDGGPTKQLFNKSIGALADYQLIDDPVGVVAGDGQIDVFAVARQVSTGRSGFLLRFSWNGGPTSFTSFETAGGYWGRPAVARDSGSVHVFVQRGDNHLVEFYCPNGQPCVSYDHTADSTMTISGPPSVAIGSGGTMQVVAPHWDGSAHRLVMWNWGVAPGFRDISSGHALASSGLLGLNGIRPDIRLAANGSIHVVAPDPGGALLEWYLDNGGASVSVSNLSQAPGGSSVSGVPLLFLGPTAGRARVYAAGQDGSIFETRWGQ